MRDVNTIVANGLCSGCGLCAGVGERNAIAMRDSAEGFRRPVKIDTVPDRHADLLDADCPGATLAHRADFDAPYDPVWGPVIEARLGWSTDAALRRHASSGGALSALLLHLIATSKIDYVLQTAVSPASPLRNALVESTGREDVYRAAGSRYAPSSPLEDIDARLEKPESFAFVGKPCDVAALRQLARHDPRVDEKVPYMIAFMCAGVPSYRGTSAVLDAMGVADESQVTAFRYRGDGWPGEATATLADGSERRIDYDTSWGGILNRHLQFRCKICPDGTGEFADVTCADGWYLDADGAPDFEEREGRSIVLSRTAKGERLVAAAIAAKALDAQPTTLQEVARMQPYQARRKGLAWWRLQAMALSGRRRPGFHNLALRENARRLGLKAGLRALIGSCRRLVAGKEA